VNREEKEHLTLQPACGLPSLDPHVTKDLVAQSDMLVSNWAEFSSLLINLGAAVPEADESSPSVPEHVATGAAWLRERQAFQGSVLAVTRGRHGVVIADCDQEATYSIAVDPRGGGVATRSAAGDRWAAAWTYFRLAARLQEPEAGIAATKYVAEFLGLQPGRYEVSVECLSLPLAA